MNSMAIQVPNEILILVGTVTILGFGTFVRFIWWAATSYAALKNDVDKLGEKLGTEKGLGIAAEKKRQQLLRERK